MSTNELNTVLSVDAPNAVLRGGPGRSGQLVERYYRTDERDATVKVRNGNSYDHFRRESEQVVDGAGRTLRVFTWTHRTYVAE
ncbi:hypothetical protein GA0074692_3124 [Micromonospora pallida]|uniref:Uncharacterized protein n=1 Tax=Micromonospora pallida TaxID=145854 RepID=A0A1C6SQT7_9ACTN|nr:DUF5988 family protein [Micromonospora pallida]SCL31495.1 hypothetical protein GA0074692_3124 [Micromonospora pallida]